MNRSTIFLADDHTVVRDGMRSLLEAEPDLSVIGEAGDGAEAARSIETLRPDIALLDISMPGMNGLDVAQRLHDRCPAVKVIILSMVSDSESIYRAFQAGALGYLLKTSAGREVVQAVRATLAGKRYLSDQIAGALVDGYRRGTDARSPLESLSPRERQLLQLHAEGRSTQEIAQQLSLSPRTVETYRARLMEKLAIKDLRELVLFAIKHGVIRVE